MTGGALGARLSSVAELVRQGAVFADIGTDHGYLPIFLLKGGIIDRAVLSDINEGPLASARQNVNEAGLSDKVEFILTDGAAALADKGITDYAICGMGGELIADIIEAAEHLKSEDTALILQPMTRQAHLRRYLCSHGFSLVTESYSTEDARSYVTMLARYTGECRDISDTEAEIGMKPADYVNKCSQISYLESKIASYEKALRGKKLGGDDASKEMLVLRGLEECVSLLRNMITKDERQRT